MPSYPTHGAGMDASARQNSPAAALKIDQRGNVVPDPATDPEGYRRWREADLAAQRDGTFGVQQQQDVGQTDMTAAMNADRDRIMSQQPAAPANSGQFSQPPPQRSGATLAALAGSAPVGPSAPTIGGSSSLRPTNAPGVSSMATTGRASLDQMAASAGGGGSKVEQAAGQAGAALGPAPQMDKGYADRQLGAFDESLGMSREVLDRLLQGPGAPDPATQATIDRLLNAPSIAKQVGARALEAQLSVARSARGGPGAVQDALNAAQQAAPQLQAQASQAAAQEDMARTAAAGNLAQSAQQNENARLGTAGNVASNFAQAALGARGQDIQVESENVRASTALMQEITKLTGTQLQLDQQNEQFLGQMARDWAQLDFDFSKMEMDAQNAWFDRQVQIYGIDQNVAAQMKAIAAQESIGPADWFNGIVGVVGAGATVGSALLGG